MKLISLHVALMAACCLTACDVSVTVGYNDALVPGASCPDEAPVLACASETCAASELTPAQMGKETLAVDLGSIFFITPDDVISRMPKSGGDYVELAQAAPGLERMTLDEDNVYWTEHDGRVFSVPKAGGDVSTTAEILGNPVSIASHAGNIYIAMPNSGEIAKIDKGSGATTTIAGQAGPIDLGVDSEHVYWINEGDPGGTNGELVRAALGDLTSAEVVRSELEDPLALGVAADAILWATYDKLFRLPRAGGEPQVFEVPFGDPKGVAELDGIIYVAGESGLFRVHVGDGDALALDSRGFTGIALSCDALYAIGWYEPVLVRYGP